MEDRTHELILIMRIAELSAENAELHGILNAFIKASPKEKPSLINITKTLAQARSFWSFGNAARIRREWMSGV